MKFKEAVTYDDMLMVPQYSDIISRGEVDIGSDLSFNTRLSLPIIASPMDTVSEVDMAVTMSDSGGLAIIHRYNTIDEQSRLVGWVRDTEGTQGKVAAAIGVSGDYRERAEALVEAGVSIL
ncbi:MAG: IMP dehydrogenase, partial [Porticoccaceae bacterium]|nr:IMP dehydrogenase [Porticoccaceae bacterium]